MKPLRQKSAVTALCLALVLGSGVGAGAVGPTATNETTATQASASIAFDNQFSDGLSVDVANYELGSYGREVAIWTVSNGSADEVLGSTQPKNDSGSITLDIDAVSKNQTLMAAVHRASPGALSPNDILASDTATVIVERSASVTFNDQTNDGRTIGVANYDIGSDGETLSIWTWSNGSSNELLGSVSPEDAVGSTNITLDDPVTTNRTLVAAVHSGPPTVDNALAFDTAAITVETVPATINFNDQTSDGKKVLIENYELGTRGESIALWSTSNSSLLGQQLDETSPPREFSSLSLFPLPPLAENQTLAAAVHSGSPAVNNVLTVDTAVVTVNTTPSVGGNLPATNLDGDPLLEDVDGNLKGDVFDAITFYNNMNSQAVQNNPQFFDFDGNGRINVFDAIELYNKIQQL